MVMIITPVLIKNIRQNLKHILKEKSETPTRMPSVLSEEPFGFDIFHEEAIKLEERILRLFHDSSSNNKSDLIDS